MLLVTSTNADRPLYVSIQDVTAVAGPVHENKPISPGKTSESWVVEVFTRDQRVHTLRFTDAQQAADTVRALVLAHAGD